MAAETRLRLGLLSMFFLVVIRHEISKTCRATSQKQRSEWRIDAFLTLAPRLISYFLFGFQIFVYFYSDKQTPQAPATTASLCAPLIFGLSPNIKTI